MSSVVVSTMVYARQPGDPQSSEPDDSGVPEEVDVGSDPAAIVETLQDVGGFVVAADENGRHWCGLLP